MFRDVNREPLTSIRDAYCYLGKASQIVMKGDRLLIDPIMKFKANCSEIQEYLHVSQYDSLIDISHMRLVAFTLLTPIRRLPDT
jgi:hypothetical protein